MAKAARKKSFEPMDHKVGQDNPRDMPIEGDAELDPPQIEVVSGVGPKFKDLADELAFMEEPVTVMVHETTDKNPEPVIQTACNGRNQFFIRGRVQTVKRKFVEVLMRAKTTTYTQERYQDANGNDAIRNIPRTTLHYPFSVVEDKNPRGGAWLQKILAEA